MPISNLYITLKQFLLLATRFEWFKIGSHAKIVKIKFLFNKNYYNNKLVVCTYLVTSFLESCLALGLLAVVLNRLKNVLEQTS